MCGIAGFTMLGERRPADPRRLLGAMTAALAHRGPDGEGHYLDEHAALGHRRLSIIDLERGAQPMASPDGRYQIVFNGEIYNYVELREQLIRRGCAFSTRSDTEVLLQQLIREGPDGLQALNGMFAFALWDRAERTLLLARDRIGKKPLYYARVGPDLVFASELKSLLLHPGVSRKISLLSVSKYLTFGYVPAPHTIYEGVFKLEPGTFARFSREGLRKAAYWDIPLTDHPVSAENIDECAQHLLELLRDAVAKRLRSDVPVGVLLSGGIDSSAVAVLAAGASPNRLHTFSIGFEESTYDESRYARQVAELCRTEHHHEVLSMRKALELLPEVMRAMDEPFGDPSIVPTYLLSRFASRHVKVVLGGDGGDELFAGYPAFQAHRVMERLSFLPVTWRDAFNRLVRRLPVSHRYASAQFLLDQFMKGAGVSPEVRFFLWLGAFSNEQKQALLTPAARQALLRSNPFEDILNLVRQSGLINDFPRILYLCMKLYLQDDILVKVDRASMAHGLEVRAPFLDHNLVEYVSGIQNEYKLRLFQTKYVLKRALTGLLPPEIIHRRKAGFMMPVAAWIGRELRETIQQYCSPGVLAADGLFSPEYAQRLLDEHLRRTHDHRKPLWTLLCFQMWRAMHPGVIA